jgi:hypothetical protein
MLTREMLVQAVNQLSPILTSMPQDQLNRWVLMQPLDQLVSFYKVSPLLQARMNNPELWRALYVRHYVITPPTLLDPQTALLSEFYYRSACEEYRQTSRHFYLQTSDVKLLLREALMLNPTHLPAAEFLLFLYREYCLQLLIPEYSPHMLNIAMLEAQRLAKALEFFYPLISNWRMACFYSALAPYMFALGGDYNARIRGKLEQAIDLLFHRTPLVYPCEDGISFVMAPLGGIYVYPSMPAIKSSEMIIKNHITIHAIDAYQVSCQKLFNLFDRMEVAINQVTGGSSIFEFSTAFKVIRKMVDGFTLMKQPANFIFANITVLKIALQEKLFTKYPAAVTNEVSQLINQLNVLCGDGQEFKLALKGYLEACTANILLPQNTPAPVEAIITTPPPSPAQMLVARVKPLGFLPTPVRILKPAAAIPAIDVMPSLTL